MPAGSYTDIILLISWRAVTGAYLCQWSNPINFPDVLTGEFNISIFESHVSGRESIGEDSLGYDMLSFGKKWAN